MGDRKSFTSLSFGTGIIQVNITGAKVLVFSGAK